MNVLAIGNSFSQDATRYLHQIAQSDQTQLEVVNLFIGGCSLSRHYRNMRAQAHDYELQINGHPTGFFTDLKEALLNRDWDFVTLQQVSHLSVDYATYQPYASALAEDIRQLAPRARVLFHETWAYEQGSARLCQELGYSDQREMARDVQAASRRAAEESGACGVIPCGQLFQLLQQRGLSHLHRDTFHAGLGLGRYALGLLWYRCLTQNSVLSIPFDELDVPARPEELQTARECVEALGLQTW